MNRPPAAPVTADTTAQEDVVLPPLRPDLIITRQTFEGRTFYVIKDPISLQYFRLTEEDYFAATLFDGKRTFGAIRAAWLARFPALKLEHTSAEINERLTRFAGDLALLQFVAVQGSRLRNRWEAKKQQKQSKGGLYAAINKLFFSRFSVFDPDEIFGRMAKPLWWIWTPATMAVSVLMIAAAVVVFIANWERAGTLAQHFFSIQNWLLIYVTMLLIRVVHELGHGLTCKHYGGEVHEVGIMFLVFTPCFFVNVSDSWTMPKRRHRIFVSAAGIWVELVLASIATFLWAFAQPGFYEMVLYNIIFIASVSTVLFNANPLMRFDGYYIATDLLEVPNLQQKSRALITLQVKKLLFGSDYEDGSMARLPLPRKRVWLFYTYAVASWLYGYFLIYKITIHMGEHLAPLGLEGLTDYFSFLALFGWVLLPLIGFFKSMKLTSKDWAPGGRLRRLACIGAAMAVLITAVGFIPRDLTITRAIAVTLAAPDLVRAETPGFIAEVFVKEGDILNAGDPVAKLSNREAEAALAAAEARYQAVQAQLGRALGLDRPAELRAAQTMLEQAGVALERSKLDCDKLLIRTRTGGLVLSRELDRLVGRRVRSGEQIAEIAPLETIRIKVPLSEKQVRYVKRGQAVELKAAAYSDQILKGTILDDPVTFLSADLPPVLSTSREGDVEAATDRDGREIPLRRTYDAVVEVQNPELLLRPGMSGRARIHAGRYPFGKLFWQSVLDLIRLDLRF